MMLGVVFTNVGDIRLPVDEELALACAITYPIKAHVNHFRSFFLDGVVGEAICGIVADLDWSGRMWAT